MGSADGLGEESVEEEPASRGPATIEVKGELVEVIVQVLFADGALMRAQAPALEEGGHTVDPGEGNVGGLRRCPRDRDAVLEAPG